MLIWKLDGLEEYDIRRPVTPRGTNLLGIVKHVTSVELEYFGPVFDRPHGLPLPWLSDIADPNAVCGLHQTRPGPRSSPSISAPAAR